MTFNHKILSKLYIILGKNALKYLTSLRIYLQNYQLVYYLIYRKKN